MGAAQRELDADISKRKKAGRKARLTDLARSSYCVRIMIGVWYVQELVQPEACVGDWTFCVMVLFDV